MLRFHRILRLSESFYTLGLFSPINLTTRYLIINPFFSFWLGCWQAICDYIFIILVISPKIYLKVEDDPIARKRGEANMNIFYIIGVVVVVLFIAGYFGFR